MSVQVPQSFRPGFRPGHAPAPQKPAMQKPHIHTCVLTSKERTGWLNPFLTMKLIEYHFDPRFKVTLEMVMDLRCYDSARNYCVHSAKKLGADFCLQFDNDICPRCNMLDVVSQMGNDILVCGMGYAAHMPNGLGIAAGDQHEVRADFIEVDWVGAGALVIHRKIWETVEWPLFRWEPTQDAILSPGVGEDVSFSRKVRAAGFKVWSHRIPAAHFRTADLTESLSLTLRASSGK